MSQHCSAWEKSLNPKVNVHACCMWTWRVWNLKIQSILRAQSNHAWDPQVFSRALPSNFLFLSNRHINIGNDRQRFLLLSFEMRNLPTSLDIHVRILWALWSYFRADCINVLNYNLAYHIFKWMECWWYSVRSPAVKICTIITTRRPN